MGKGDQRTKKGKRHRGSYGKTRPRPGVERKLRDQRKKEQDDQ